MSYDLTNQFISNTFGNLLQKTGSGGYLYDLKGNQIGDIKISGSLTAQEYIVSSSVTNVVTLSQSGSNIFGDSSDDTHQFTGSIDILGNVTASGGMIVGDDFHINSGNTTTTFIQPNGYSYISPQGSGTAHLNLCSTYGIGSGNVGIGLPTNASAPPKTLTVGGDISASGDFYSGTRNISQGILSGSTQIATDISGSSTALSSSLASRTTTLEGNVGQAVNTDSNVQFNHITASGNISSSGTVTTNHLTVVGDVSTGGTTLLGNAVTDLVGINGRLTVTGPVTASGNISASGDLYGSTGVFHSGNSNPGIFVRDNDSHIISSSGGSAADLKIIMGDIGVGQNGTTFTLDDSGTGAVKINKPLSINTNTPATNMELTVQGDISASGTIHGNKFLIGSEGLIAKGNESTFLTFGDTQFSFEVAGEGVAEYNSNLIRLQQTVDLDGNHLTDVGNITSSGEIITNGISSSISSYSGDTVTGVSNIFIYDHSSNPDASKLTFSTSGSRPVDPGQGNNADEKEASLRFDRYGRFYFENNFEGTWGQIILRTPNFDNSIRISDLSKNVGIGKINNDIDNSAAGANPPVTLSVSGSISGSSLFLNNSYYSGGTGSAKIYNERIERIRLGTRYSTAYGEQDTNIIYGHISGSDGLFLDGVTDPYVSASQGNLTLSGSGTAELEVAGRVSSSTLYVSTTSQFDGNVSASDGIHVSDQKSIEFGDSNTFIKGQSTNLTISSDNNITFNYDSSTIGMTFNGQNKALKIGDNNHLTPYTMDGGPAYEYNKLGVEGSISSSKGIFIGENGLTSNYISASDGVIRTSDNFRIDDTSGGGLFWGNPSTSNDYVKSLSGNLYFAADSGIIMIPDDNISIGYGSVGETTQYAAFHGLHKALHLGVGCKTGNGLAGAAWLREHPDGFGVQQYHALTVTGSISGSEGIFIGEKGGRYISSSDGDLKVSHNIQSDNINLLGLGQLRLNYPEVATDRILHTTADGVTIQSNAGVYLAANKNIKIGGAVTSSNDYSGSGLLFTSASQPTSPSSDYKSLVWDSTNGRIYYTGSYGVGSGGGGGSGDIEGVDLTGGPGITISDETNTTSGNYSATLVIDSESIAPYMSSSMVDFKTAGEISSSKALYIGSLGGNFVSASDGNLNIKRDLTVQGDIYTDKIRRATDSGTTTKILLNDEVIKLYADDSSNEVVKISDGDVSILGSVSASNHISASSFSVGSVNGYNYISSSYNTSTGNSINLDIVGNEESELTLGYSSVLDVTKLRGRASLDSYMIIGDGKLGIGNRTPSKKLTVQGDISASGTVYTSKISSGTSADGTAVVNVSGSLIINSGSIQPLGKFYNYYGDGGETTGSLTSAGYGYGDIVKYGATTGMTPGELYYMNSSGNWAAANASDNTKGADELLGIALGPSSEVDGVLLQGMVKSAQTLSTKGAAVYMHTTDGELSQTRPSGANNIIRLVGYVVGGDNVIYFRPSSTWLKHG